jgi:diketogulonate reductase-like aldo/keto reductase
VDRLCFGTSTFAAGRLCPDKDSRPGIAALSQALVSGVRLIHSNPNLGTQWAVRDAIEAAGRPKGIRHVVKVELPLDAGRAVAQPIIERLIATSLEELGAHRIHAVAIEADLKRTEDRRLLVDSGAVTDFYERVAELSLDTGVVETTIGYCHSPAHLTACLQAAKMTGCAAQCNLVEAWPALYLDQIQAAGRSFLAMAPLRRGLLLDELAVTARDRLRALRWILAHPGISCTVITISSLSHLSGIFKAMEMPLPIEDFRRHVEAWQAAGTASTQ